MLELLKTAMLAGLGAAVLTREKVQKLTSEMVEQGRMSAAEAERLAEEILEESKRQAKTVSQWIDEAVNQAVAGLDLVKSSRVAELEAKIATLEARVAALEASPEDAGD